MRRSKAWGSEVAAIPEMRALWAVHKSVRLVRLRELTDFAKQRAADAIATIIQGFQDNSANQWIDVSRLANHSEPVPEDSPLASGAIPPELWAQGVTVDYIQLGGGERFRIVSTDVKIIPGKTPTVCPHAEPTLRSELLPAIEQRWRDLGLVGEGQTVHWVGRQATMSSLCLCKFGLTTAPDLDVRVGASERVETETPPAERTMVLSTGIDEELSRITSLTVRTPLLRLRWWWHQLFPDKPLTTLEVQSYLCANHGLQAHDVGRLSLDEIADLLKEDADAEEQLVQPTDVRPHAKNSGQPDRDGPQGPHWLWWKGQRYRIGQGQQQLSWKLLDFFWNREQAHIGELHGFQATLGRSGFEGDYQARINAIEKRLGRRSRLSLESGDKG